jgi:hypothetical protein
MGTATTTDTTTPQRKKELKRKRAKARRLAKKGLEALQDAYKPVEEWDNEELARGRPRNVAGHFTGPEPKWMTAQLAEEAQKRFSKLNRGELRVMIEEGMPLIRKILTDTSTDKRGRPTTPISVKWDALKWLLEMEHGKPTTRIEGDISVRLQAMLGSVLVNPDGAPSIALAEQVVDAESWEEEEDEELAED